MNASRVPSALLSAGLVCWVAFLGISAGQAEVAPPAVLSPLATASDPALSAAQTESAALTAEAPPQADTASSAPPGDAGQSWKAVSAGNGHSCAIKADDTLVCWGDDTFGQTSPPEGRFFSVAAGMVQSCAIREDGKLLCWGSEMARPKKTPPGTFKAVSAGNTHTCAIRSDDTLVCWGNKTFQQTHAPQGGFESLSAGGNHTCALQTGGYLQCWGEQSFLAYPQPEGQFKAVATGEAHACALRQDDTVVCWGNDGYRQIQAPAGAFQSLSAGSFHTCGLRFDGATECWGQGDTGQTAAPSDTFKALSAGGVYNCGMRSDDTLQCWGSNAHDIGLKTMQAQALGAVQPQAFPFAFLIQVAGFLGTGLVNYGKGVDQTWSKQEAKNIRFQMGLLGASLVFAAFQQFLPKPPDPVAEALKRIEADIQELKAAVGRIDTQVKQIQAKLNALACNTSLQPLVNAGVKIETAQASYLQRLEQAQIVLKAYAARAQDPTTAVPDPNSNIAEFVRDHKVKLETALNAINEALVPAISTKSSALDDCMEKSFGQWKAQVKTPFADDRTYYQPIYEILGYALGYQGMALTMLQDIQLWEAQQKLQTGKIEYQPDEMVGFCANVRSNASKSSPSAAFWQQAQVYCNANTALTQRSYERMVRQVERVGAPYADDDTRLSLGPKLIGKHGDWQKGSWLWLRDVDTYGVSTKGFFASALPQPPQNTEKDFTLYQNWEPASQAWLDVDSIFYRMNVNRIFSPRQRWNYDLLATMEVEGGFKKASYRMIWISGKTFNISINDLIDFHSNETFWREEKVDEVKVSGLKCFVISNSLTRAVNSAYYGSNDNFKKFSGMVCDESKLKFYAFSWAQGNRKNNVYKDNFDINIDTQSPHAKHPYSGWAAGRWKTRHVKKTLRLQDIYETKWQGFDQKSSYFPDQDKELDRWPVIDIEKLQCTNSMANKSHKRHKTTQGGVLSRCGDDLDRVINSLVPRPTSLPARNATADAVDEAS